VRDFILTGWNFYLWLMGENAGILKGSGPPSMHIVGIAGFRGTGKNKQRRVAR